MPWNDWQFWVVTIGALGGLWLLLRPFVRSGDTEMGCHGCNTCPTEPSSELKRPKLVSIGGK